MKAIGIVLLIIGVIAFFVAFNMDTTVASDFGSRRIHNIGLMNDRQNIIIVGGVLAVIGAIFVAFARKSYQPTETAIDNSSARACPYCAETIKAAATICRFCQKELPPIETILPASSEKTASADQRARMSSDDLERIAHAIFSNNIEAVKKLIATRVDVNIPNENGVTALRMAKNCERQEIYDLLVEAGARE